MASVSRRRWNPAFRLPFSESKTGLDLEEVGTDVWTLGVEFFQCGGIDEPLGGELQVTVIQILALEGAEREDFSRREGRFEIGGEVRARGFLESVAVATLHLV